MLQALLQEDESLGQLCDFLLSSPNLGAVTDGSGSYDDESESPQRPAKRPRKREAHEIAILRAAVADLTRQREALMQRRERAVKSPWEMASRRQAAGRHAAECERDDLKAAIAKQTHVINALEAVLRTPFDPVTLPTEPRLVKAPMGRRRATAEALLRAEYGRLESVILTARLHENAAKSTCITYDEAAKSIRLDCTMADTHDMAFELCGSAIWKYYNNLVPMEVQHTSFVILEEWDPDTTYGRLIFETPVSEVHCLVVQKRFVEPNRVVICSATITEDEKYPYSTDAFVLHESTWIAIEKSAPNQARVSYCGRGSVPCVSKKEADAERLVNGIIRCYNAHLEAVKQVNYPSMYMGTSKTTQTSTIQALTGHVETLQHQINTLQTVVLQQQQMLQAMLHR
ncbi:hypothetical protein ACHHYP_02017 [Achlya hypogyna]|uniref:Uncharacterized protein n=1 Tax=Achlya hypogyna TaxID=1202772 RepID=A0A1V9Z7V9_ACHHY|nr:hypothetical protein ACHHYP_02017 [Achlya hypogyna]